MKLSSKYRFAVFVMMLSASIYASALGGGQSAQTDRTVYDRIKAVSGSLKSLTCDFTETRNMAVLASPAVKKGKLSYLAPDCMRWEYDVDNYSVCNSSGGYMIKGGRQSGAGSRAFSMVGKLITSFISGKPADPKQFSMSSRMEKGDFVVILTPRSDRLKVAFDHITMRFDAKSGLIKSYETYRGDDSTILTFSNIKTNIELDRQLFN